MAMLQFMETSIPEMCSRGLYDEKGYDIGPAQIQAVAAVMFKGTSEVLKNIKSKEYPVAFVFEEMNLELDAAAIVRYIPNEDPNMPGNWNYVWTFDKADIPNDARIVRLKDAEFQSIFRANAAEYHFGFHDTSCCTELGNFLMKQISKWLSDNAKEDEEIGVELEGIFQARAIVEDKEVIKSMEVIGETKAIIKDDAGIEV